MNTFAIAIDGMHCAACVRRVQAALDKTPGVAVDELTIGTARGTLDEATVADVIAAVERAGYTARPAG